MGHFLHCCVFLLGLLSHFPHFVVWVLYVLVLHELLNQVVILVVLRVIGWSPPLLAFFGLFLLSAFLVLLLLVWLFFIRALGLQSQLLLAPLFIHGFDLFDSESAFLQLLVVTQFLIPVDNCPLLYGLDKLLKGEFSAVGRYLFEGSDDVILVDDFPGLVVDGGSGHLEILQEEEEALHGHVHSVVLQPIESHVRAHSEHVRAVVSEHFLQVAQPQQAQLSAPLH